MTEPQNIKLVREMYDAYLSGDNERSLSYFHPDVKVDFTVRPDAAEGRGRDELARIVGSWVASWDDYHEEIIEIRAVGEEVVLIAIQRGRGRGSGVEVETRYASRYEIEGGQITSITSYVDIDEALK